ncbi:MAG: YaiO family outer membrane beta-barrel protein [Deltaproteobacteria bacterium]
MHKKWQLAAVLLLIPLPLKAQEQTREFAPPIIREPGKWAVSSYYDRSTVKLRQREGNWAVLANTATYAPNDLLTAYVSANLVDFFRNVDSAGDLGAYLKFKDAAYLRAEIGFGGDVDYIYHFQTRLEYEHRLFGKMFWQTGARYLDLTKNDVYTAYPGLIYYWGGKNYVTAFYHYVYTQDFSGAEWVSARGNCAITKRLSVWLGAARGNRIYNIELLPSSKQQYGYLYLGGLDLKISRGVDIKLGYSYARQKPTVTRHGIQAGVLVEF